MRLKLIDLIELVDSPGIMDSIVDSLEKLRSEMTNSCLKVDVSGFVVCL